VLYNNIIVNNTEENKMTEQELIVKAREKEQESINHCASITAFEAKPLTFEQCLASVRAEEARKEKRRKQRTRRVWTESNYRAMHDAENEEG
jgi:hypothetical protein